MSPGLGITFDESFIKSHLTADHLTAESRLEWADGPEMQYTHDQLVGYLKDRSARLGADEQFWLGIAGAPGSGKSWLSQLLRQSLGNLAVVVPMDGYHYYQWKLDQMPDPQEAHKRRGAPFTFDVERFVRELTRARICGEGLFPSFDHGAGDPVENDIHLVKGQHKVIILEGNYLLLNDEPWNKIRTILDESWFLDVDIDVCKERVRQRFLDTGRDEQTARFRVEYNDGPNAQLVTWVSPTNADRVISLT